MAFPTSGVLQGVLNSLNTQPTTAQKNQLAQYKRNLSHQRNIAYPGKYTKKK